MISIFGFQDEFFIMIDDLNPMRNYAFRFSPGFKRFSTRAYNALLRSRYYCTAIFSALFELPSLLFFLNFFTGEKCIAIFSHLART